MPRVSEHAFFGVIDVDSISELIGLPEEETVAALIAYGYEDGHSAPTPRKDVYEIMRLVGENPKPLNLIA